MGIGISESHNANQMFPMTKRGSWGIHKQGASRSLQKMLVGGPGTVRIINAAGSGFNELLSVALAHFNHLSDAHGARHPPCLFVTHLPLCDKKKVQLVIGERRLNSYHDDKLHSPEDVVCLHATWFSLPAEATNPCLIMTICGENRWGTNSSLEWELIFLLTA